MKFVLFALIAALAACQQSETITPATGSNNSKPFWSARVSTINVWGIPLISRNASERMPALGKAIAVRRPDFVFLQETWSNQSRTEIAKSSAFEEKEFFENSGLMFLSRTSLVNTFFAKFTMLGRLIDIFEADAWSGKGVAMATTIIGGTPISMFNTHLIARYSDQEQAEDKSTLVRLTELFEVFASIVENADSASFVVAGDFNMRPMHTEYQFWKELTGLEGLLLEEKDSFYCTSCSDNSFNDRNNGQLDYIFVSPHLKIQKGVIDFTEKVQAGSDSVNLSDHYGLTAELRFERTRKDQAILRTLMAENLNYLKVRIEAELGGATITPQGFTDQLCRSCNLKTVLKKLYAYIDVLEGRSNDLLLTGKINDYIGLF
jgi:endonuclease/exonuclease/phosphatase family metal-dependent hydrolase